MLGEPKSQAQVIFWSNIILKEVQDNSKVTGQEREKFEFFEHIDSFMGCSDNVNHRFVGQTVVLNEEQDQLSFDERKVTGDAEEKTIDKEASYSKSKRGTEHDVKEGPTRKRSRKQARNEKADVESFLLKMLETQHISIRASRGKRSEDFEGMIHFQAQAEERHKRSPFLCLEEFL